jgi:hypothetical protein
MNIVTLRRFPELGLWVDDHPVFTPPLDSVLADAFEAHDLAEEWSTDVLFLDKSTEYDYLVYLPSGLLVTVRYCGELLGLA